jgi:membrane protein
LPPYRLLVASVRELVGTTLRRAWHDRVLGLAAEAGFWQLLSLPSLILAVLGVIGFFNGPLGADNLNHLQRSIEHGLSHVIVPSAVHSTIEPALHRILFGGRADVVSISFVVSLWTGSSAMATYVNTITIAYGLRHQRGAVRSRLLALRLYLSFVVATILLLPLLVLGPSHLEQAFPDRLHDAVHQVIQVGYWPVVLVLSLVLLATLYHQALPIRTPWSRALPGAALAVLVWVIGSTLLRLWLDWAFRKTATYGPLSAPVAVLLFLYLTALAILLGAELNAEIDRLWPRPETAAARAEPYAEGEQLTIEEEHGWPARPEDTTPQPQSGQPPL